MNNYYKVKLTNEDREVILHPDLANAMQSASVCIKAGANVYFKWDCLHCGSRQTFDTPNTFHVRGKCEECKNISDLLAPKANVSFMMMAGTPFEAIEALLGGKITREEDE